MLKKINRKITNNIIIFFLISILFFTRFINLSWGLPYSMHPDERNMAVSIEQLSCRIPKIDFNFPKSLSEKWPSITNWIVIKDNFQIKDCFNPNFFAYGQFPLYLGYLIVLIIKFFGDNLGYPISFQEAILALRIISAFSSVILAIIIINIIEVIKSNKTSFLDTVLSFLIIIFLSYAIQFAHFGTTESLLMVFYSLILYYSLLFLEKKIEILDFVLKTAFIFGLAMATKVSSMIFCLPVIFLIFLRKNKFSFIYQQLSKIYDLLVFLIISLLTFFIFSPHNFINFDKFISSFNYEKAVGLGEIVVFYTRQFLYTYPIIFQIEKILPYSLGLVFTILSILGILTLNWQDKKINLLRFGFFIYFLINVFVFVKWTRFMAPIFPILTIFGILMVKKIKINLIKTIITFLIIIDGILFLNIYLQPDIRFQASQWIFENIPEDSYILSETANVVDIPLVIPENEKLLKNYQLISFNFYDLDENIFLQEELRNHLQKADYILIPSRRIFANHYCGEMTKRYFSIVEFIQKAKCQYLKEKYPVLNQYYDDLFSGRLGFEKVAEFSIGLNDEIAEETFTVFDHPVIRIYKKVKL